MISKAISSYIISFIVSNILLLRTNSHARGMFVTIAINPDSINQHHSMHKELGAGVCFVAAQGAVSIQNAS